MGSEEFVVLMFAVRSVCECSMRSAVRALSVARCLAVGRGTAAPVSGSPLMWLISTLVSGTLPSTCPRRIELATVVGRVLRRGERDDRQLLPAPLPAHDVPHPPVALCRGAEETCRGRGTTRCSAVAVDLLCQGMSGTPPTAASVAFSSPAREAPALLRLPAPAAAPLEQRHASLTRRLWQPLPQGLRVFRRLVELAHEREELCVHVVLGPGGQLRFVAREEREDEPQLLHDGVRRSRRVLNIAILHDCDIAILRSQPAGSVQPVWAFG